MTEGFSSVHNIARRKPNRIDLLGSLTVTIPVDEVFVTAIEGDEATLASTDGAYTQTLQVGKVARQIDEETIQLVYRDVVPNKKYTLTYDTKLDADGAEVLVVEIFSSRTIEAEDLKRVVEERFPFHNKEDGELPEL